ncbi:jun-like transcription factor [Recurvomyces mirabilis]|nr:jun-like transcription factor [Recurvomyces mirabilis]
MARTKPKSPPVRDLLAQLAQYLEKANYRSTLTALLAEAREHEVDGVSASSWEDDATLESMWQLWKEQKGAFPTATVEAAPKEESKKEAAESNEDSSDDSDSDDETEGKKTEVVDDEAESTSDDSSDEEEEKKVEPAGTKRKREATPDSSSEDSSENDSSSDSSDDSSDDETAPPAKRTKTDAKDESSSDDSSDDSSSESGGAGGVDVDMDSSSASSSDSDSDSDSNSDSDSSSGSSSESAESDDSSDSSSSSDSDSPPPSKKKVKKAASPEKKPAPGEDKPKKDTKKSKKAKPTIQPAAENDSAASSVTLPPNSPIKEDLVVPTSALSALDPSASTPASTSADETSGIHPDRLRRMPATANAPTTTTVPATAENVAKLKKSNVPFSRIPKDTFVDPKFSSNEYVSYDYADRAHRDLIVTKGKGFTKEKNKKKRGAYRGGAIDFTPKGIKFDD